jgi:hypothetical protein
MTIDGGSMDEEEIKKRDLLYEMEDKLWALLRRRAWIVGILGLAGIWAVVQYAVRSVADQPLQSLQKQLTQAEILAERAKGSATAAANAADQVSAQVGALTETLQALSNQARVVEERIKAGEKNAALRSDRDSKAFQERIDALEALVKRIGAENEASKKATSDYARKVADLERRIEAEQKRFAENSAYTVLISFGPGKKALANEVQSQLARMGFKAVLNEMPSELSKGNILTYDAQVEKKADEISGIVKPILKDISIKQRTFIKAPKDFTLGSPSTPGGTLFSGYWSLGDRNNLSLIIGG